MSPVERRRQVREHRSVSLTLCFAGRVLRATTTNISAGGASAKTNDLLAQLAAQESVGVAIISDDDGDEQQRRWTGVQLLRFRSDHDGSCEAAMRFVPLSDDDSHPATVRRFLRAALRSLFLDCLDEPLSDVLRVFLGDLCLAVGASDGLLYLADRRAIVPVDNKSTRPPSYPQLVIAAKWGTSRLDEADSVFQLDREGLSDLGMQRIAERLPAIDGNAWISFGSPRVSLCEGLVLIAVPKSRMETAHLVAPVVTEALQDVVPTIEALFRRQLHRESRVLIDMGSTVYMREPTDQFERTFVTAAKLLNVRGSSLFVKGTATRADTLQLVATWPRQLSQRTIRYASDHASPTLVVVGEGRDCIIRDVHRFRALKNLAREPVWCDITDTTMTRSLMYTIHTTENASAYILRCTNSTANPSRHFHELDSQRAKNLTAVLSIIHKALETESRALRMFLDPTHDLRQKLQGIRSAANTTRRLLISQLDAGAHIQDVARMEHVRTSVNDIIRVLNQFKYPLPSRPTPRTPRRGFHPFRDLVRNVCETFLDKAQRRRLRFVYRGQESVGFLYMSPIDLRRIVENLINNAVKYTDEGKSITIAFESIVGGGWKIHFSSESLRIYSDERERIFDYKYRGRSAQASGEDGDGLGLCLSQFVINRYGGRIDLDIQKRVHTFTVVLPKHLFERPLRRPGLIGGGAE